MQADCETLETMEDFGKVTAESIREFFTDTKNIELINELKELGLNMTYSAPVPSAENTFISFDGKTFVLTGTLPSLKRAEAQKLIEDRGGKCSSSVSAKTDFVLAGEEAGSKLDKAVKLGIKIINEEEFKAML